MKNMVISILGKPEVAKIKLTLAGITVQASSFQKVKAAIQSGKIKMKFDASLGSRKAKYRYTHNELYLGFRTTGGNADIESMILHECVHAACDIEGVHRQVRYSEAAAYVAQALYFYYRHAAVFSKPGVKPTFTSSLLREAWEVAMKARKNSTLSTKDVQKLLGEIARDSKYRGRTTKIDKYDGL